MDIHPLAVIIARATYLLAISDLIPAATEVVNIPVYLCNSLSGETLGRSMTLLGEMVELVVGRDENRRAFEVPEEFVADGALYDQIIGEVVDIAHSIGASRTAARHAAEAVRHRLVRRLSSMAQPEVLIDSLANMAIHIANLVKLGLDSIYGFLLRNRYRSILLRGSFDLVVGNPPWLTLADISAGSYRGLLLRRNKELGIAPRSAGEQAHTEIATVFLAQVVKQFIRYYEDAQDVLRLGFVLPRSIFAASHHRFLREGAYKVLMNVAEIWDLGWVDPLFNIPSSVLFVTVRPPSPQQVKPGRIYSGRLPARDPDVALANERLTVNSANFVLRHLGKRSAWGIESAEIGREADSVQLAITRLEALLRDRSLPTQVYVARFEQGAILYPQVLFMVDQVGGGSPIMRGPVTVRTSELAAVNAKLLRKVRLQRVVDAESLFLTVAAEHLLPYGVKEPLWTVILPVTGVPSDSDFGPVDPDILRSYGLALTADWFDKAEAYWESARKPSERTPLWQRLDYMSHFTAQAQRARYVVVFPASPGVRMCAAAIDTRALVRPFIVRDKIYWMATDDPDEAYYMLAFLNSTYVDRIVSDFVTRGLFGKRDAHKRSLDVPWPKWNRTNEDHVEVARLAQVAAASVRELMPTLAPDIGRARGEVRRQLDRELMAKIEQLVAAISAAAT
jgi:hypothetical protein